MTYKYENEINAVVNDLIEDYKKGKTIDKERNFDQPSKTALVDILCKLQKIIYPGYFRNESYKIYTTRNHVTMLVEDVMFNLTKQICIVFKNLPECNCQGLSEEDVCSRAERISLEFLDKLPKIREYINTDVEAAFDGDPAAFNTDEIIFSYPGVYAIFVYRIAHELFCLNVPIIPRMMTEYAHEHTGIDIHPGAVIGKYFFIDHGTGIVIGETTNIGENVKLYQGVTLGALSTRGGQSLRNKKRHPTIEDNVTIYSGASILGGETVIGRNSVIGGNAFITSSISEGARVSIKNLELHVNYDNRGKENVERVNFD
ncbi:MAG: serine acetyltransferase [Lachnospiraceae bacterium]|nr:serine acetyltransferase [Lachnospiraceae bacterium]